MSDFKPKRRWERNWVRPRFGGIPAEMTLEPLWSVDTYSNCDECSYHVVEFNADSRQGLVEELRRHLVHEKKRIKELIAATEALPDIGDPHEYLLSDSRLVSSETDTGWTLEDNDE